MQIQTPLSSEVLYALFQQLPEKEQQKFWMLLLPNVAPPSDENTINTTELLEKMQLKGIPSYQLTEEEIETKYALREEDMASLKGIFDDVDMTTDEIIEAMDD